MIEWFKSLTFFNWLALIAFCLALVGFLNSFLSLRSRYKDWKGGRNKKAFEKRLKELKRQVEKIGKFRREPHTYYRYVIHELVNILLLMLWTAITFAFSYGVTNSPTAGLNQTYIPFGLLLICFLLLGITTGYINGFRRRVAHIDNPASRAKEVKKFINNGVKNNVVVENEIHEIIKTLKDNDLIRDVSDIYIDLPLLPKTLTKAP
jgi:hypothetical protein